MNYDQIRKTFEAQIEQDARQRVETTKSLDSETRRAAAESCQRDHARYVAGLNKTYMALVEDYKRKSNPLEPRELIEFLENN